MYAIRSYYEPVYLPAAVLWFADHKYRSAWPDSTCLRCFLPDGQPQSPSSGFPVPGGIHPVETLEDFFRIPFGHSGPLILYGHADPRLFSFSRKKLPDGDLYYGTPGSIFQGVVQKIPEDLPDPVPA